MAIVTGKGLQYLKVFWEGLFEKVVSEQRFEEIKGEVTWMDVLGENSKGRMF